MGWRLISSRPKHFLLRVSDRRKGLCLRRAEGGEHPERGTQEAAVEPCAYVYRADCNTRQTPVRPESAKDTERQDHAKDSSKDCE